MIRRLARVARSGARRCGRCTVPAVNLFSAAAADCADFMRTATGEVLVDGTAVILDRIDGERIEFTGVAGNATGTVTTPI